MFLRFARKTFGSSQILSRLRACYRTQDAQWKLRSLEAWKFGQASRCAAITVQAQRAKPSTAKNTKNHKGTQREGDTVGGPCVRTRCTSGPKGLREHGGLRTPRFGNWESSGVSRRPSGPICPIGPTALCRRTRTGVFAESFPRYSWDAPQEIQEIQERPQAGDGQTAELSVARRGATNQPISQSANQPIRRASLRRRR